jgi:hypothetical protein
MFQLHAYSADHRSIPSQAKYLLRVSNVGLRTSVNIWIQGHALRLVEVEGTHPVQNVYDSLDIHAGQ